MKSALLGHCLSRSLSCLCMSVCMGVVSLGSQGVLAQGRYSLASPLVKPAAVQPAVQALPHGKGAPVVTPVPSQPGGDAGMPSPKVERHEAGVMQDADLSVLYAELAALQLVVVYKDQALMRPVRVDAGAGAVAAGSPAAAVASAQAQARRAPLLLRHRQAFTLGSQVLVPMIDVDQVQFFLRGRMSAPVFTAMVDSSGLSGYGLGAQARDKEEVVSTGFEARASEKRLVSSGQPSQASPVVGGVADSR